MKKLSKDFDWEQVQTMQDIRVVEKITLRKIGDVINLWDGLPRLIRQRELDDPLILEPGCYKFILLKNGNLGVYSSEGNLLWTRKLLPSK